MGASLVAAACTELGTEPWQICSINSRCTTRRTRAKMRPCLRHPYVPSSPSTSSTPRGSPPVGRELSIAVTKLQEAAFFVKRGIASMPEHQQPPQPTTKEIE